MNRRQLLTCLGSEILVIRRPHPIRVAVDGPDSAGKTTLADELRDVLLTSGRDVIRASIDDFQQPREARYRRGELSPEGYYHDSFDYDALEALLLRPLGPGGDRVYRIRHFDLDRDCIQDVPGQKADQSAILILDGVFLHRDRLRSMWEYSVFVQVEFATVRDRAVVRDAERFGGASQVMHRYAARYVPGQQLYYRECHPRRRADVVVRNDDPSNPEFLRPRERS